MPGRAQEKEEEDVVSFLNMSGRPAPRFLSEDPRVAVSVIDDVEKKLTKVCDKSGTAYIIVHLHHKDRLCVMGIAELWVCRGSVHVLGYDAPFGRIDRDRLNVDGGAISLGHPVGTSGNRIVLHLANAMKARGEKRGIATECIGGGLGGAMMLEAV